MNRKALYQKLCENEAKIPIFSQPWWLNAVMGEENWDVVLEEKNGEILGCFPFTFRRKWGQMIITMPRLTPWHYIYLKYPEGQKYATRLAYEKRIMSALVRQLPKTISFHQKYHYAFTNWLPFYWAGYRQTTRYSYVLEDLTDLQAVFSGFRDNIRREIRKAEKRVRVEEGDDVELLYHLATQTFSRQNQSVTFSRETLVKVDAELRQRQRRKIWLARDRESGVLHAGLYLVWDSNSAYYLIGGADPALRTSGASSLLMWQAIQFAATVTQAFDFEGSMIEPIERYFRSFGAIQKPYFSIFKRKFPFSLLDVLK